MAINQSYVKAFLYDVMFGKNIKPGTVPVCMSVENHEDVLLAVKKAYIDMSPRTFKEKDKQQSGVEKKDEINRTKKDDLLKEVAQRISNYMKGASSAGFDIWHKELCDFFIDGTKETNGLRKLLEDANKDPNQATFGKAQKLVNMTFKYMYCFDDANQHIDKFDMCHMPLDSYILDWFFDWYKEEWKKQYNEKMTKNGKNHLSAWSDLKYAKDPGDKIPQYKEIQSLIKQKLRNENVSCLEAEFVIWWEARNKTSKYTY